MDPVSLGIGAGIALVSFLAGRASNLRRKPTTPTPWCTCDHPLSSHDPTTAKCQHFEMANLKHKGGNRWDERVPCPCVRYVGPEPLPASLWTPALLGTEWHVAVAPEKPEETS